MTSCDVRLFRSSSPSAATFSTIDLELIDRHPKLPPRRPLGAGRAGRALLGDVAPRFLNHPHHLLVDPVDVLDDQVDLAVIDDLPREGGRGGWDLKRSSHPTHHPDHHPAHSRRGGLVGDARDNGISALTSMPRVRPQARSDTAKLRDPIRGLLGHRSPRSAKEEEP